jgi:aminoglycoside phosphotransferase (APT) family kinase protein
VVSAEQLSRDEVVAFLCGQPGTPEDLEALSGGGWSSAWAYRAGGEELVVRFGPEVSWYEADRMAMAFAGPDLPVPEVREVGTTPSGRAFAISVRHHGRFLEDTPVEQAGAIAPTLTRLLVALYRAPAGPDTPVLWHQGAASAVGWREFLLDGLVDDPGKLVRGWSAALAADPELAALSAAVTERVRTLVDACPERRDLVHGDLLHGNVLVSPDARRIEAVLSGALRDAGARHHCYELHIGFTHLGWNIWTGNQADLAATARRLAEVLERGPLPLASARPSAET